MGYSPDDLTTGRGIRWREPRPSRKRTQTLEQKLWEAADALRGNQQPSEYKHVVLGLVFLKYISDRFEERRAAIEKALSDPDSPDYIPNESRRAQFIEDRDEYASHNVFWVRWTARTTGRSWPNSRAGCASCPSRPASAG